MKHMWMCDAGDHFRDDDAMAERLAERIDAGDERIMFSREGCMFRLTYEDRPYAETVSATDWRRSRTYSVVLLTNSPTCVGGNLFAATWPSGYAHEPVRVMAKGASTDASTNVDGTRKDISGILTSIGVVVWPELYDI